MTRQEELVESLRSASKLCGDQLGRLAEAATHRPPDFFERPPAEQWAIDKTLGILDWTGEWWT